MKAIEICINAVRRIRAKLGRDSPSVPSKTAHDDTLPGNPVYRENDGQPFNADNPLHSYIPTVWLIALVEEQIRVTLQRRLPAFLEPPEEREAVERALRERLVFLEWLQNYPDKYVFVGMYPRSEFEDDNDDEQMFQFPPFYGPVH